MANQLPTQTRLQLFFITGIDLDGNDVVKGKSFNNMKTDATASQLLSVSNALASLQQHTLKEIKRNDTSLITEA
ncbi:hypothetical protein GCM10012290_22350 [Halolactibacillus alkaliphilus]|uniref:DUF1659 domain-containing protein n=1 Tax=Halolactibacillus alkaliphilus TaxID=442899 RepID=A0A511X3Z8_9BACI|nr:DUF1659 domain-containing protein [Halolactibacillus alkaliphilus]GEN57635.1 hypothetical protein HAL01_20990 [Halolactibacillus alkaliphilus]GGN74475.1 hypothetical protein GCM10012290_22350 [Halolactibacillus alkaliphilus]SFP01897.1 Protein of unknown function [Halolactibacillus alkaliphilus]